MIIYPDSSFLISLYSPDANSAAALALIGRTREKLILTPFTEFEVANAFELRVFRGQDKPDKARRSLKSFEQDVQDGVFHSVKLPEALFVRAREIVLRTAAAHGTRSIDLLHVAAALELGADILYSFDERQRQLAGVLRLRVN